MMMNVSINEDDDEQQTLTHLLRIHSLTYLLEQDRQQLALQSSSIAYYHPHINREQAEQLLQTKYLTQKIDGLFLLRNCSASQYDFSLSIVYQEKSYHYKIQFIYDNYFSIDSGPQIAGIENLVRYYQEHTDGLVCVLANEFLQGQPPPITSRSIGSTNTLHRACQQGNLNIVRNLLSLEYFLYRPDINGKDSQGSTALHQAAFHGHDDIVRLLLKAGCHIFARDVNGATALHRAAAGNRPSILMILINEGLADYEERNYTNCWVPLHEAAYANSVSCIRVLLDYGAPIRARTDQGKTPLQLADEMKCEESSAILRSYKTPPAKSSRPDWFHDQPKFDRVAAKQLIESIRDTPKNGMFLVRYSSKNVQNYALTLSYQNDFYNFEITRLNETTFYIDDGPYFDTLEHLIDHYCRIPDGLPTTLTCSINQFNEIVPSRVQPFIAPYTNTKMKELIMPLKRPMSIDRLKTIRSKFPSSLSSSVNSLSSSSSRSRASSFQESPLSTSSSSGSLSSNSPPKQTSEESSIKLRKINIDRRKTINGKIKPYLLDFPLNRRTKRLTMPIFLTEKPSSSTLILISPDQIQQITKLGEGEFGEVYHGRYEDNSTTIPVAIKIMKDYSYSAKQDFLREAEHMSKLNHHCICKLYGIVDNHQNEMMMVIELLLLGSMLNYLSKHQLTISEYRLKVWAAQIANGMAYMESKGIVHRDLAARNILLQSIDQVKISDFGLSRCIDKDIYVQRSDSKIPVKWYAPEAISIGKFTSKSDVWSFGVTLWEMFSYGATPYGEKSGSDVYYSLKYGKRLERPSRCPSSIYELMLECWEWDEKKRPTFAELLYLLEKNSDTREISRRSLIIDEPLNESESKTIIHF